jgi:hypothetical protein
MLYTTARMNSFICKLKGNQRYSVTEMSFSRGVKKADEKLIKNL